MAGAPDMSKVGPTARKPTNEAASRKEIDAFMKAEDALIKAKNFEAMVGRVDFPVHMVTDSTSGVIESELYTREQYRASMEPMWANVPADSKVTHKLNINVLSDSIASVVDDYEMTMGKQKVKARNASLLVKVGGQWKYKMMSEAGWAGMGGSAPAPAAAAPAAAAPAPAPAPGTNTAAAPKPAPAAPTPAPAPKK
jgi:hypothetical protein